MKHLMVAIIALVFSAGVASAQMQHQHPGPGPAAAMGAGMGMQHGPGCGPDCMMMHGKGRMGMGKGMGGGIIHMLMMNADELKLTDEQVGKLHRMMWKNMEAGKGVRTKLRESKMAVHKAMTDPAADDAAVRAAAKAHTDAFNAKIDAALKERAAALAVLTDAQRKAVKTLKPKNPMMGAPAAADDEED